MQLFQVIFILITFSFIEIFGDEVQEIVPVPPLNYTKPPYSVKIVGGSPARLHQFPWQASITSCEGGSCYICGGSLISKRYVLTAAHCAAGLTRFVIGLGSNSRNRPAVTLTSNIKVVHPQYDAKSLGNDVAVIKLPWSVKLNKAIQPIILPRSNNTYDNANATVSGYGKTSAWSSSSDQLNFVDMRIISNGQCREIFGSVIRDSSLCAVGKNLSRQNVCQGDSGGPLVVKEGNSTVQVGVVSFVSAAGCAAGYPSGYARVSSFYEWIANMTDIDL
uniref:Late trypsin n=1 Tax=Culicoides sonorensis TaxID=179676 RepID=Q66UD0_CULSO|nr:late trypsin [Culicoides sonorensis]